MWESISVFWLHTDITEFNSAAETHSHCLFSNSEGAKYRTRLVGFVGSWWVQFNSVKQHTHITDTCRAPKHTHKGPWRSPPVDNYISTWGLHGAKLYINKWWNVIKHIYSSSLLYWRTVWTYLCFVLYTAFIWHSVTTSLFNKKTTNWQQSGICTTTTIPLIYPVAYYKYLKLAPHWQTTALNYSYMYLLLIKTE